MATRILQELREILRRDAGIESSLQQVEQLSWMVYLKVIDDRERGLERIDPNYRSHVPEAWRWRNWALDPGGLRGEELIRFVGTRLFADPSDLAWCPVFADLVGGILECARNYVQSGEVLRQVIERLNEFDFSHPDQLRQLGDEYDQMLCEHDVMQETEIFIPPRALTQFIVDRVDPALGDKVLDPACGVGGFLVRAIEHLGLASSLNQEEQQAIEGSIHGDEVNPLLRLFCVTNVLLHGIWPWRIGREHVLTPSTDEHIEKDQIAVIVTYPPSGLMGAAWSVQHLPAIYRTRDKTSLFLLLTLARLRRGGRAAIVVPDEFLSGRGVTGRIKEKLLEDCNLHTIVRLPAGVFSRHERIKNNLLFFTKGAATQDVWYYEHPRPSEPQLLEEFEAETKWWTDRRENEHAWRVPIGEIKARGYNLDFANPNKASPLEALRLSQLWLRRFRGFEKLDLRLPVEGPAVFIGVNGAGKSSVLDGAAALLTPLVSRMLSADHRRLDLPLAESDVQTGAKVASVGGILVIDGADQYWEYEAGLSRKRAYSTPEIGRHAEALIERLRERESANVPVLCYYPATRGLGDETDGKRPTYPFRQLYAYDRAFRHEAGHFQDFIRWFRLEEDLENQIRLRDNSEHRSPLLNVVRRAIERFLSVLGAASFSFLRIERPKEVMPGATSFEGSLLVDKDGKPLRIDQLSEGERNTILLVADLARRFALANPGREDPLEGSGIVLIDEIDLHLHPAWQRSFLPALMATFPRCQFLVSTHSPQALSRIPKENVFVLENFELQVTPFTYGRDSNSILDEVMGVPERPEDVSAKIREVAAHIDRDRIKEARAGLNALADLLGEQDSEVVRLKTLLAFLND